VGLVAQILDATWDSHVGRVTRLKTSYDLQLKSYQMSRAAQGLQMPMQWVTEFFNWGKAAET
jgi:hypothetical protein